MKRRQNDTPPMKWARKAGILHRIRYRRTASGYTLIEVLIALAISLIGFIGGLTLYSSGAKTLKVGRASTEIQQGARKALETIIKDLQETTISTIDVSVPYAIRFASAQNAGSFALNSDGTPDWKNAVVYFLDTASNTLCRYIEAKDDWSTGFDTASAFDAVNPEQLVPHVTNLEFSLVGNLLSMTIEMSDTTESVPISKELTTQVYVRN